MPRGASLTKASERKGAGRPTKASPNLLAKIIECAAQGLPPKIISQIARIDETTLFRWINDDPDFAAEYYFAKAVKIKQLHQRVEKEDPKFILKNSEPTLYRDRIENEISGKDGEPIQLIVRDYRVDSEEGDSNGQEKIKSETKV